MTSYEFYRETAHILSAQHGDKLFDYIIHSMDDNWDFLRTRWCYWDKTLQCSSKIGDIKTALVALKSPFDFENCTEFYEKDDDRILTVLKMQLFNYDLSGQNSFDSAAEWSAAVGYPYPIKIDMINRSYEILPRCEGWGC